MKTYLPKGLLFASVLMGVSVAQAADVTQPGDPIFASSANSPGSEGVANAIDGKTTKYLNFDSGRDGAVNGFSPSGFVVVPSIGVTHVTGMTVQSANDGPERDPKTVTLEGSNDSSITNYTGGTWSPIATISLDLFTDRFQVQSFSFTNNQAYKAYRWTATETAKMGADNTCCMQVAEIELLGEALPQDVTQPGDPIIASSANSPGSEGVANVIDNKTTKYLNFDSGRDGTNSGFSPSGFIVTPSIGRSLVTGMTIQSANDGPERDPKTVTLEGSNDTNVTSFASGNWESITAIDVPIFDSRFQVQTFLFDNVKPYRSYRWITTATAKMGADNTCCMQVAEVELLGTGAPVDVTQPGDPIIASSANSPGSEGVANVIDNKTTKYLNFDSGRDGTNSGFSPSGFVVTPSVGATKVIGMTIQSANDGPERDPQLVKLEGSNDTNITSFASGNWTEIATITAGTFTNRFDTQEFYFENPNEYTSYRWTVLQTAKMGADNTCCMQVAEVELLAVTTSAPASARFLAQPIETPVLANQSATFYSTLNGPWPVQWSKNGVAIPGATQTSYTTEPVTAANATNVYTVQIVGRDTSTPVHAVLFSPSATKSVAISFSGGGANGSPTTISSNAVIGVWPQAFWNNSPSNTATGDLPTSVDATDADGNTVTIDYPFYDSDGKTSSITASYAATGNWGAGTGVDAPTDRMLNGVIGTGPITDPTTPNTVTFHSVPAGKHSVLIYAVSPPLQVQSVSYNIGSQTYYLRVMNSDEYNAAPGFYRGTSTNSASPSVADFVRFDNVQADANGDVILNFATIAGGGQATGVNGIQLVLNAPASGAPPTIGTQPQSTVAATGGTAHLSVTVPGTGLTYQWRKNGRNLPNGSNISGAQSADLIISAFGDTDAGVYSVVVFDQSGNSVVSKNVAVNLSNFTIGDAEEVYLPFDATTGTTVANTATGGQAGTVNGTATWGAGKITNALSFDGSTFINVPGFTKPTKLIGVSLWVNADPGLGSTVSFVRNGVGTLAVGGANSGLFDFGLATDADNILHLQAQLAVGPNIITVQDPTAFTLGAWHNVAFTVDGTQLHLYVDGQQVAATDYTQGALNTPTIQFLTVGGGVTLDDSGVQTLDSNNAFVGKIDDLAVFGRVLSPDEIAAINTAGNQGKAISTVTETPPVVDTQPTITVARAGNVLTFSWTGSGFRLQSSDTVKGTFADVSGVTGTSATVNIDSASKAKFYRLVK